MATINDIVLVHFEDNPLVFARIEDISPDSKPGWYHVKLLLLQVPLQAVTWILRDVYISGSEFTMNGKKMRLEKVECPEDELESETTETVLQEEEKPTGGQKQAKVISLADLKKK
jgi:hypothetical protein